MDDLDAHNQVHQSVDRTTRADVAAVTMEQSPDVDITRPDDHGISPTMLSVYALAFLLAVALPLSYQYDSTSLFAFSALLGPLCAAIYVRLQCHDVVRLPPLFIRFVFGWVALFPIVLIFSTCVTAGVVAILPARWLNSMVMAFVGLASFTIFEDLAKVSVMWLRDRRDNAPRPELYIYYTSATTLGLVSAEIFYILCFFRALVHSTGESTYQSEDGSELLTAMVILTLLLTCLLAPMQMLSSYHVGMAAARVQVLQGPPFKTLAPVVAQAVLARLVFMFSLAVQVLVPGAIVAWAIMMLDSCLYPMVVERYQGHMPSHYLRATGYMHLLGYGALPETEDDADAPVPASVAARAMGTAAQDPVAASPKTATVSVADLDAAAQATARARAAGNELAE